MKTMKKAAKQMPDAELVLKLMRTYIAFRDVEATYFAVRGFAVDLDLRGILPEESQKQLDAIVALMECKQRILASSINETAESVGVGDCDPGAKDDSRSHIANGGIRSGRQM
jgi:hypothetical protein